MMQNVVEKHNILYLYKQTKTNIHSITYKQTNKQTNKHSLDCIQTFTSLYTNKQTNIQSVVPVLHLLKDTITLHSLLLLSSSLSQSSQLELVSLPADNR